MSATAVSSPKKLMIVLTLAVLGCWCLATNAHAALYWSTYESTSLPRANTDGSEVNLNFIPGGQSIYGVAVSGSHIYWLNEETGTIGRANLDGTDVDQNFITGIQSTTYDTLAVDAEHIYVANYYANSIGRANIDGTGFDEEFISGVYYPYAVAVQGDHLYWTNYEGDVARSNLDGSGREDKFIAGVNAYYGLAVNSEYLYWTDEPGGSIGRATLGGQAADPNFITGLGATQGIAVDSEHLYWTTTEGGVYRGSLQGTNAQQIVPGTGLYYYQLAADVSQPTLTSVASPGTVVGAGTLTDTATLAGATGPSGPTGTLTFRLYGPGDETCGGAPAYTDTVAVKGNGSYSPMPFTPTKPGVYRWTVSYSGDYQPLSTACAASTNRVEVTPVSTPKSGPAVCSAVLASPSAEGYVPPVKPGKTVKGVRARITVGVPSRVAVDASLTYRSAGKKHTVDAGSYSIQVNKKQNLRIPLPKALRAELPIGTKVDVSLRLSATPGTAVACATPSTSVHKLKLKVVRVLTGV